MSVLEITLAMTVVSLPGLKPLLDRTPKKGSAVGTVSQDKTSI